MTWLILSVPINPSIYIIAVGSNVKAAIGTTETSIIASEFGPFVYRESNSGCHAPLPLPPELRSSEIAYDLPHLSCCTD
ncbi:hypothetical protein HPP92_021923 [Vanilla planifolia]|uniref:Uncharacterized protein n=1 Tax=Vanilla planifolia TaxID=51239 RepID=A0A835Q016_VANPL|nr:hypothetical protein HPP92_021923 [Vanilla planifolia]